LVAFALVACDGARRESLPDDTQILAQWLLPPEATPLDLHKYFAAETLIARECRQTCSEDGNDIGGGTFNVFLYTADIDATVALLVRLDEADRIPDGMRIGVAEYTNAERTDWTYRAAYPEGLTSFSPFETDVFED
jgi:hypothetical protein